LPSSRRVKVTTPWISRPDPKPVGLSFATAVAVCVCVGERAHKGPESRLVGQTEVVMKIGARGVGGGVHALTAAADEASRTALKKRATNRDMVSFMLVCRRSGREKEVMVRRACACMCNLT
jgi:hypothetical protein